MGTFNTPVSNCRHCQFYQIEGRRGGLCQQLGVSVQSTWTSCALAIPVFSTDWNKTEKVLLAKEVDTDLSDKPVSVESHSNSVFKVTDESHRPIVATLSV
jgi:hypothetical protein